MLNGIFSSETIKETVDIVTSQFAFATWETLYATIISTFSATLLGLPLAVLLCIDDLKIAHIPACILKVLNIITNLLRSVPFLILMIIVFPLSRVIVGTTVGTVASIVPLVIAAFPFVARLFETSFREINPNTIEMSMSLGATPWQIITKVLIPETMPSLVSNLTTAITTILGYTAMSGAIGGGGLGKIAINYGYYRFKYLVMILAVILLIILVEIFQTVGTYIAVKIDKRNK